MQFLSGVDMWPALSSNDGLRLCHHESAVDEQIDSGDIGCVIRDQKGNYSRNVFGFPEPTKGNTSEQRLLRCAGFAMR